MPELLMMPVNAIEAAGELKEWSSMSVNELIAFASREVEGDEALSMMSEDAIAEIIHPALTQMGYHFGDMMDGVHTMLRAAAWAFDEHQHTEAYAEYFAMDSNTPDAAVEQVVLDRAERMMILTAHPFFKELARDFIEALPPRGLARLLVYIESIGWKTAEQFFRKHEDVWRKHPEHHGDLLTRFYYNAVHAKKLALDTLVAEPMNIDPKEEMGEHGIDITIDTLQESPFLRNEYADILTQSRERDDQDFTIEAPMQYAILKNPMETGTARAIGRALMDNDQDALLSMLDQQIFPQEDIPESRRAFVRDALGDLAALWATDGSKKGGGAAPGVHQDFISYARRERAEAEKNTPLPNSADPIRVVHHALRRKRTPGKEPRERTLPAFTELLQREMAEAAVALALLYAPTPGHEQEEPAKRNFLQTMIDLETKARALYKDVHETGMPVFRDFICEIPSRCLHFSD